jgi:integrase
MKGHIRERSPGHWAIILDARDPVTGERKRRWHSFAGTKRQAQVECARLIAELQSGAAIDLNKITVAEFLDCFERDWVAVHVSRCSGERYHGALGHVRQHLGDRSLQKLRAADIASLYATMTRAGSAPRTIQVTHVCVHRALSQAKAWGLVRDNVAEIVKPPRAPDQETAMLQPAQAAALLDRLRGKPLYLLASLGLGTGMRRSEMLALRWQDIDLDAGRLTIERSLEQTTAGGVKPKSPKTRAGRRTISLPPRLVAELQTHWRDQQQRRLALGIGRASDDSPVLAAIDGGFLSPNGITKAWPRTMAEIGMAGVTLHSLRHTHASTLIASGMDVLTVSRRLGHASAVVTLRVYGHLIAGTDDRAAAIIEAAFGNGSSSVAGVGRKPQK